MQNRGIGIGLPPIGYERLARPAARSMQRTAKLVYRKKCHVMNVIKYDLVLEYPMSDTS